MIELGTDPIVIDNLDCNGDEVSLWDCQRSDWGQSYCHHDQDAGVVCGEYRVHIDRR